MMRILRPMSGLALPLVRRKVADIHAPVQNIMLSRWTPSRMRLAQPEKMSAEVAGRQLSFHPVSVPMIGRKIQPAWQAMDLVLPNGAQPAESNKITSAQQASASELLKKLTSQSGVASPQQQPQATPFKNPFGPLPPQTPAAAFNNPFGPLPPETQAASAPATVWKKPEPGSRIFRKIEEIHAQSEKTTGQPPVEPSAPAFSPAPAAEPTPAPSRPAMMRKVEEITAVPESAEDAPSSPPAHQPPAPPPALTPAAPVQRTAAAPAPSAAPADAGIPPVQPAPVIRRAWKVEMPAKNPYDDEPESAFLAPVSQSETEPEPWQQESFEAESSAPTPPSSLPEAPQTASDGLNEIPSGDLPEIQLPEPAPFSPPEATLRHPSRPAPQVTGEPAAEPSVGSAVFMTPAAPAAQISRSPAPEAAAPSPTPPAPDASPEPGMQRGVEPTEPAAVEAELSSISATPSPVPASTPASFPPLAEQAPSGDVQGAPPAAVRPPTDSAAFQPPARLDLPVTPRQGVQRRAARTSEPEPGPVAEIQYGAQPTAPQAENRPFSTAPAVTPPAPPFTSNGTPSLQRETNAAPEPAVTHTLETASPSAPTAAAPPAASSDPSIQRLPEAGAPFTPPAAPMASGIEAGPSSSFPAAEPLQRQADEVVTPPPHAQPESEPFDAPASTAPAGPPSAAAVQRALDQTAPPAQPASEQPASPAPGPAAPPLQRIEAPTSPAPLQASPVPSSLRDIPSGETQVETGIPPIPSALNMDLAPRRHPGLDRETSRPVESTAPSPLSPASIPPVQRAAVQGAAHQPATGPVATNDTPAPAAPEPAAPRPPLVEPSSLPLAPVELAGPGMPSAASEPGAPSLPPTAPAGDLPLPGAEALQAKLDLTLKAPIQRTPEAPAAEPQEAGPGVSFSPEVAYSEAPVAPAAQSAGETGGEVPPPGLPTLLPVVQRMNEYSRVYRSLAASLQREAPPSSSAAGSTAAGNQPPALIPSPAGWPSGPRSAQGERTAGFVLRRFRPLAAAESAAAASQPSFTAPSAPQVQRAPAPSPAPPQPGMSLAAASTGTLPAVLSAEAFAAEQGGAPVAPFTAPAQGAAAPAVPAWQPPDAHAAPGEIRPLLRPGTLISRVSAPQQAAPAPALERGPSSLPGTLLASPSSAALIPGSPLSPAGSGLAQRTIQAGAASPYTTGASPSFPWSMAAGTAAVGPASRPGSATRPVELVFRRSAPAVSTSSDVIRRSPGGGAPASNYYAPDEPNQSSPPAPPFQPPQDTGPSNPQQPGGAAGSNYYSGHSASPPAPPAPDSPPGQASGAASSNYYVQQNAGQPPAARDRSAQYEINPEWAFSDTLMAFQVPPPVPAGPVIRPATPEELAETETSGAEPEAPDVNLKDLARQIYPFVKRMLALERERTFSRKG